MKLNKLNIIALFVLTLAGADLNAAARDKHWLSYGPAVVELAGKLTVQLRYGPPNFGENPKTDAKIRVPVLMLTETISVRADPQDPDNSEVKGVRKIQLILYGTRYEQLIGRRVLVKGTLFHANTGGHYTDVVMSVRSIRGKKLDGEQPKRALLKPPPRFGPRGLAHRKK